MTFVPEFPSQVSQAGYDCVRLVLMTMPRHERRRCLRSWPDGKVREALLAYHESARLDTVRERLPHWTRAARLLNDAFEREGALDAMEAAGGRLAELAQVARRHAVASS